AGAAVFRGLAPRGRDDQPAGEAGRRQSDAARTPRRPAQRLPAARRRTGGDRAGDELPAQRPGAVALLAAAPDRIAGGDQRRADRADRRRTRAAGGAHVAGARLGPAIDHHRQGAGGVRRPAGAGRDRDGLDHGPRACRARDRPRRGGRGARACRRTRRR
ncbi:hypothetical protein LTR94_032470, partial [Friedmanniomyces endolithicus]